MHKRSSNVTILRKLAKRGMCLMFLVFSYRTILSRPLFERMETHHLVNRDAFFFQLGTNEGFNYQNEDKQGKLPFLLKRCYNEFLFYSKFRPSLFYGRNLNLLNNAIKQDQVFYLNHFLDVVGEYHYGFNYGGYDIIQAKMGLRNEGIWGNENSILATTQESITRLEIKGLQHSHYIPRFIFWIRELWVELCLNNIFDWCRDRLQSIMFGAFPFSVGRGISLGIAYQLAPEPFGLFSRVSVNQYAFGIKLTGQLNQQLSYDLYWAILNNKAGLFRDTNAPIRSNEYGRRFSPQRGFGVLDYAIAGRFVWNPILEENYKVIVEPYFVFNDDRELREEFLGDSRWILMTPGLAAEFEYKWFEFGFDASFNMGHEYVKGIDRNVITEQNRCGVPTIVNSYVNQINPETIARCNAIAVSENQTIIESSCQSSCYNDQIIGTTECGGQLINSASRFRDPYTVSFKGRMAVFDMGFYLRKPDYKLCIGAGYASGDDSPAQVIQPGQKRIDYNGFISLQDEYTGGRLKSAFLLAGAGNIPRAYEIPRDQSLDLLPTAIDYFTNIIYTGANLIINLPESRHKWKMIPNFFSFWQAHAGSITTANASIVPHKHLGFELNLMAEATILPDMYFFGVMALFLPGKHYRDVSNIQLTAAQELEVGLDSVDLVPQRMPDITGSNNAWYLQIGMSCVF